ncbi:MAG: NAD(P)H-dependent oxidoreductase [Bacteroidia bacterium]|nr:NAD(P)H-dependent oxidoreductase [Bacteroidia bacterium]
MNIAIISGSARANNNTLRVAKAIKLYLESNQHLANIVDFTHYDLPLINQGTINSSNLSTFQNDLITNWRNADLVITISPEYNWSSTPELLNMYNALGVRDFMDLFNEKTFAFVGVSTGKGGKMPCLQLIQVVGKLVSFSNSQSFVSPKIFESHFTKEVLDESGISQGNALFDKGLVDFIDYNLKVAVRWKN